MSFYKNAGLKLAAMGALCSLILAACDQAPTSIESVPEEAAPEVFASPAQGPMGMQDRYIVLFERNEPNPRGLALGLGNQHGFSPDLTFETVVQGFAARLPAAALNALQRNPRVRLIEPDVIVTATEIQQNATWGLDRIDQSNLPLNTTYGYDYDGTDVHAYILDTGIRLSHDEFGGRAQFDRDYTGDSSTNGGDCNGHGTHVAGTVGGSTWGVAKNVTLHDVRVLDCQGSGYSSWIIAAMDWVAANGARPAVINMSLSGGASSATNEAVQRTVGAGVVVVAAAGNNSSLACDRSPASAADAFTIGATTSSDYRSSFSNYGTCVDIFAPGSSITSSTHDSDTSKGTWNGTSMAAPHAAGVAALYLDADETLTPQQVMDGIVANATPGVLGNVGSGSPNLLLYSLGGDPPPPQDPTLIYVSGLTVDVNFGKRNSNGTATVTVSEPGGSGVGGATVTGDWMVNGGIHKGGVSGLTETNGIASIGSGALKNVNSSHLVSFCVNAVTKAGRDYDLSERPLPYCVEAGDGGGEDPPPDPPADFTLEATVAGRTVVTLTWLGSSTAPFEVFRNGDPIGTTSLFWFENTPGKGNWIYQVCDSAEPSKCTNTVRVRTK